MYKLSIVTPEKLVFEDQVISLIAPGSDGYLEILTKHAPIITSLQPGKLVITTKDKTKVLYAIADGILEVANNEATLLTQGIETPQDIDLERTEKALERAKKQIESKENGVDIKRAKRALKRAENRIHIATKFREQPHSHAPASVFDQ